MEVFSFAEAVAQETMLRAHTYGFSVCGEWYKELAEEYCKQLLEKGLIAEAKPSEKDGDDSD
jgi:ATP-dependent Clp protease adapter protein ClpS